MPLEPAILDLAGPPILAVWEGIGPLILLIFWIVRQVMTAMSEQKEAEAAKEQAEADRAQRAEMGLDEPEREPQQADLRSEVEEFLKRVGEMRDGADEPAKAETIVLPAEPQTPPPRRGPIDPFEEPVRRRRKPKPKPQRPRPAESQAEPARAPLAETSRKPARPVGKELRHLPESQLAEKSAQLGERVAQADDRVESRLQGKFDHKLGALEERVDTPEEMPPKTEPETGAGRIKALLAKPGGVREAVILSEILRRPGDNL